jgi:acetyl-CoA carboxylase carboxyltransferase component
MPFEELIDELNARRAKALAMGGAQKLAKRREQGVLNARERLDQLLDRGEFFESGLFATSSRTDASGRQDCRIRPYRRAPGRYRVE